MREGVASEEELGRSERNGAGEDGVGRWGRTWELRGEKEERMGQRKKEGQGKDIADGGT